MARWGQGLLWVACALLGLGVGSHWAQAGVERYGYDPLGRLIQRVDANNQLTEYQYDAAGNLVSVSAPGAVAGSSAVISTVTPSFFRRGQTGTLTLTGQNLQTGSLSTSDPGLDISNIRQTASQIQVDLAVGPQVPTGQHQITLTNARGAVNGSFTVGPALPTLALEPSPLALPPDNTPRTVTVRLSHADSIAHTVTLAMSDPAKAAVSPSSVTLSPGQTTALVSVTPKAAGFVNLQLSSTTLSSTAAPVFITADFRGISTSHAQAVGVQVGSVNVTPSGISTHFVSKPVGIAVGPVLTGVSPTGIAVGQTRRIAVSGQRIPSGASLNLYPASGVTIGALTLAADGASLEANIMVAADAAVGARKVLVKDASGKALPFADDARAQITVTTGEPRIDSMEPFHATPGQTVAIKVHGQHLQNAALSVLPGTDIAVEPGHTISADGKELQTRIQILPLAARGSRVIVLTTPSGSTGTDPAAANQFQIVQETRGSIGPVFAPPVGIQVGGTNGTATNQAIGPVTSQVGVLVGPAVQSVFPKVGVVGTRVELVIKGIGLQTVQSVAFADPGGLTAGTPSANPEGTRLSVQVDLAADASKSLRRLVLRTASGTMPFLRPEDAGFRVAAPPPSLTSISPVVIKAGTSATLTVLGANLSDIQSLRFAPDSGLRVSGTATTVASGTSLSIPVIADPGATTGPRVLVIATAGGETPAQSEASNTVQVAQTTADTFANAQPVGIQVGSTTPAPQSQSLSVIAPLVGVVVQAPAQDTTRTEFAQAPLVGVVVGTAISGISPLTPDGFLVGGSGTLTIEGYALQQLNAIQTRPTSSGLSFGAITVNPQGTLAQVPVTVAATQPAGVVALRMTHALAGGSQPTPVLTFQPVQVSVGTLPSEIYSVSPIVMEQGKTYTFTVRGAGLKDVYQVQAEPADGLQFAPDGAPVQWSTDALGEKLTVQLRVDSSSAVGSRVIRLRVPGGATSATAASANTITIVAPQ